jgi:hypothetical protein
MFQIFLFHYLNKVREQWVDNNLHNDGSLISFGFKNETIEW